MQIIFQMQNLVGCAKSMSIARFQGSPYMRSSNNFNKDNKIGSVKLTTQMNRNSLTGPINFLQRKKNARKHYE